MVTRMFWGLCSIEPGQAEPGRAGAAPGPDREQLTVFLADVLRGTAEERAPLVMAMSHNAAGRPQAVSRQQVAAVSRKGREAGSDVDWRLMVVLRSSWRT